MKKIGCKDCEAGEIFVYFKHETYRQIRCDFYYCSFCFPTSSAVAVALAGEIEITVEEFTKLSDQGWQNLDI